MQFPQTYKFMKINLLLRLFSKFNITLSLSVVGELEGIYNNNVAGTRKKRKLEQLNEGYKFTNSFNVG